jgi:limonene-1,2-epoxide hydrolase
MMTCRVETSTQVVSAFVAAIEGKDLDSALALVAEDVVYDNVPLGEVRGLEAIRAALARILTSAERIEDCRHTQTGDRPARVSRRYL